MAYISKSVIKQIYFTSNFIIQCIQTITIFISKSLLLSLTKRQNQYNLMAAFDLFARQTENYILMPIFKDLIKIIQSQLLLFYYQRLDRYNHSQNQMDKNIFLLDLLKDKEAFDKDEDQCLKCQDLVTWPIKCCECQAPYCYRCGNQNIKCEKCKSKWNYQKVQPKHFQLDCPFSTECSAELTPEIFVMHILTSDHVDADTKEHYQQQLVNACQKGHQLTLLIDTFKNLTSQQCTKCKKIGLARQQCEECNVVYCVMCRPLIFVDKTCNQGHKLSHVIPKQNLPFLCDRCGKNKKNPKGYYVDKKCNIGICEECFDDLN